MGKVLLAIDGMFPDKQILDYAISVCRRIKAELNILQVIDPDMARSRLKTIRNKMGLARNCLENTMIATTFAETGEHDTARKLMADAAANIKELLAERGKPEAHYLVKLRSGEIDHEIEDYLNRHRDIVLAIYDATGIPDIPENNTATARRRKNETWPVYQDQLRIKAGEIQKRLSVPLVIRRPDPT
ncbi:MAG: hypothetical protein ACLFS7_06270 [Desulfosudaceae bacterium]